jgi:sigma-E factor negative regulatory protein RseA
MTEQIKEQISVFIDDELSEQECQFFVRQMQRDPVARNLYMRYQVIGAAIRGEHINSQHGTLRSRLQSALDPAASNVSQSASTARRFVKGIVGVGIAASVATVSIFILRFDFQGTSEGIGEGIGDGIAARTDQRLELVEPPSYVVSLPSPQNKLVAPAVRLTGLQYLMHHSGHASGLSRTVVHSNVVAADDEDFVLTVEASAQ